MSRVSRLTAIGAADNGLMNVADSTVISGADILLASGVGVSGPGAFKLDHLQHVQPILSQNCSNFLPFILGGPISYYPRERKKGSSQQGQKMRKRESPKRE